MKIPKVRVNIRTPEAHTLGSMIVADFSAVKNPDSRSIQLIELLSDTVIALTEAIKPQKAGSKQSELHKIRTKSLQALFTLTAGYCVHPDESIRSNAEQINHVLSKFGLKILRDSNACISSLIDSIVRSLQLPQNIDAVTALSGLGQLIDELESNNSIYEHEYVNYASRVATARIQTTASELKTRILTIINGEITVHISAMSMTDPERYGSFARFIAQIIDNANETIKKRSGRSKNKRLKQLESTSTNSSGENQ